MPIQLKKTREHQQREFDALLLALEAPAARLARMVIDRLRRSDHAAVVEQLRYLAALIEAQATGG